MNIKQVFMHVENCFRRIIALTSTATLLLVPLVNKAQDFESVVVKSYDVQGTIKMLTGWGGNIGVLPGKDGFVLIDDQMSELSEKIRTELAKISDQPIKLIINTHYHYDHTDGNKVLGKSGSVILSHEKVRLRLSTDQLIEYYNREQKAYPADALPKVTFLDSMTLYFNEETLKVYHFDHAHTDGDAIIHFLNSNVVHMGDIYFTTGLPFVDVPNGGSVPGIINCINEILKRTDENTRFIPGHGTLTGRKELISYRDMLATITQRVSAEVSKGTLLSEISVDEMVEGYENVGGRPAADFVMFVFLSLTKN